MMDSNEDTVLDHLLAINRSLIFRLEAKRKQLKEIENKSLVFRHKLSNDLINRYDNQLKQMGSYVRQECNRFQKYQSICQTLTPIVKHVIDSYDWTKSQKQIIKEMLKYRKNGFNEDLSEEYDSFAFDYHSIPDSHLLLLFYKSFIDEIPLNFFDNIQSTKPMAKQLEEYLRRHSTLREMDANSKPTVPAFVSISSRLKITENKNSFKVEFKPNLNSVETHVFKVNQLIPELVSKQLSGSEEEEVFDNPLVDNYLKNGDLNTSRLNFLNKLKHKYPGLSYDVLNKAIDETLEIIFLGNGCNEGNELTKCVERVCHSNESVVCKTNISLKSFKIPKTKPKLNFNETLIEDKNQFLEFPSEEWSQRLEEVSHWDDSWDQTIEDLKTNS